MGVHENTAAYIDLDQYEKGEAGGMLTKKAGILCAITKAMQMYIVTW